MSAADPQLYTPLNIAIGGAIIAEATSIQFSRTLNAQQVNTIAKGLAGITPGARMLTFTVQNAVPSADFELDAGAVIEAGTIVDVVMIGPGGKQMVCKGFITEDSGSYQVNGNTEYSFSGFASLSKFQ